MIGDRINGVPDRPGWYFGLLLRSHASKTVTFSVFEKGTRRNIPDLRGGMYAHRDTAELMGLDGPTYVEIAQRAIDELGNEP